MCKERGLSKIYKNVNESLQMIDQGRRSVQTEKQSLDSDQSYRWKVFGETHIRKSVFDTPMKQHSAILVNQSRFEISDRSKEKCPKTRGKGISCQKCDECYCQTPG